MSGDELAPDPAASSAADLESSGETPSPTNAGPGTDGPGDPGADGPGDPDADDPDDFDDIGAPFIPRSFGGEFVWAEAASYTAKILRVKPGEKVVVSTRGRRDMVAMLTGGRAILEVLQADEIDRVEMMPAGPVAISPDAEYRLVAMTEVELFTIYTVL